MKDLKQKLAIVWLLVSITTTMYSQDTTKTEFKPSGKVWGYVFGDYAYKVHADSLNRGSMQYSNIAENYSSFDLRRVYLGYDYSITEKFAAEVLLSHEGNNDASGNRTVFIKLANLRWKNIYPMADLVVGQMSTNAYSLLSEKVWSYRSVEKTLLDMRGIVRSTDLGIAIQGKFNSKGDYGYNFIAGNGSGSKSETDKFKKFYGDLYAKFMDQKIIINLYGDYERTQLQANYHKEKMVFKGFLAYQSEKITAGVEAFMQTLKNNVIYTDTIASKTDTTDAVVIGASAFIRGPVLKDKLNFFVRYDYFTPDNKFNADNIYGSGYATHNEMFITAGIDYTPNKNVHIMPNIWYNAYHDRRNNVSDKTENDYDFVARLTAYFIFK